MKKEITALQRRVDALRSLLGAAEQRNRLCPDLDPTGQAFIGWIPPEDHLDEIPF